MSLWDNVWSTQVPLFLHWYKEVRTLNAALLNDSPSSSRNIPMAQASNLPAIRNQGVYRGRNPSDDGCYICNKPGHYANRCWQAPHPPPLQARTIMVPAGVGQSEEIYDMALSRLLFEHKNNSEHEQIDKPLSVTSQAYTSSFPRLLQKNLESVLHKKVMSLAWRWPPVLQKTSLRILSPRI